MPISSASTSNLEERFQHVTVDQPSSDSAQLICCVQQRFALGSVLFSSYTVQVVKIVKQCGIDRPLFVDDTGLYGTFQPDKVTAAMTVRNLQNCCCEIQAWMFLKKLKPNDAERLRRYSVDQRQRSEVSL